MDRARWRGIELLAVALCVPLLVMVVAVHGVTARAATASWPVENLGEPVMRSLSVHQAIGVGANGDPTAFFVNQGNYSTETSELVAVDLVTQKTVVDMRMPSGYAIDGIVYSAADNTVYIANGGADLFAYTPGAATVTDVGPSISGQTIWSLAAAPDGTIWGGTYPGGDIFSYDPSTKSFHNYGQGISGETYITALQPTGSTVYFGTQPDALLGELDPSSGQMTQIPLPSQYQSEAGDIDGLSLAGTRLFVAVAANFSGALVWDTSSQTWVATIANFSGSIVSPPDPTNSNDVYFRISAGNIVRYDLTTLTYQALNWSPNAFPGAWAWVNLNDSTNYPGQTLMFTYYTSDRIYGYNLTTQKSYYLQPAVQGAGDQLIALGEGPDGNVYAGAYLTPPGMGQWNPDTKAWQLLTNTYPGQVEGFGSYNGDLVFGRYPEGSLYSYDVSKPYSGTNPGPQVAIGDNQNRPVAFTEVDGQEAVGSVPVSGRLGGDISLWTPTTNAISVYSDPISNQTPVSLVTSGGLVWGGTSINGGYGISPAATSAELFAWDPTSHQVVYSTVPLPGAANVSGLALDGQGHLWFLADSTLFEFDLATHQILGSKALASGVDGSMYGIEHQLLFDHGRLFATDDGQLFHVDTVTWAVQTLYSGPASNLTQDRYGQLYFVQNPSFVYRYDLPTTVYTPTASAQSSYGAGRTTVSLQAAEPGGVGIQEIDYRVDGGSWQVYSQPFTVAGRHVIDYRAVDNAWSASGIQTLSVGPGR